MERRDGRNCTGLRYLRRRGHAPEEPNALGRMVKKIEGSEYPEAQRCKSDRSWGSVSLCMEDALERLQINERSTSIYIYNVICIIIPLYIIYICSIYCTIKMNNRLKLESKRDLNILNLTLSSFQSLFDPRQSSKRRWVVGPGGYGWMDSYGSLKIRLPICFIPASNFGDQSFWAIAVWIHVSIPPWPSDCRNPCPESSDAWRMIVMAVSFFWGETTPRHEFPSPLICVKGQHKRHDPGTVQNCTPSSCT